VLMARAAPMAQAVPWVLVAPMAQAVPMARVVAAHMSMGGFRWAAEVECMWSAGMVAVAHLARVPCMPEEWALE